MVTLRRRTLLLRGATAAAGIAAASFGGVHAQPGAADDNDALARWRPARPPKLEALDLASGQHRTLADFAGHPLLVNFWASWCGPCRVEMPSLNTMAVRFAASHGLKFIALNHGEMPERVQRFLAEVPIAGTVLLDRSQTVFAAWGGQALPATFVLDAAARPLAWAQGERDWAAPSLVAAMQGLMDAAAGKKARS